MRISWLPPAEVPNIHHLLPAFPEGDKLLIGHGWPEWRPKGDMTCLPCLRLRRMEELCRSSTFSRTAVGVTRCWLRTPVELLQSSYTFDTTVRQGSRFAPTLPYQAFNPFGVGELWGDVWRVRRRRMAWREWDLTRRIWRMWYAGVFMTRRWFLARRAAEILEFCICDAEGEGW